MIDPTLREAADARARSAQLSARLIAALPKRPSLVLLDAASWPLLCWLAPRIGRAQVWRVVDPDAEAIDDTLERIADWAADRGLTVSWPKRAMLVHLPGGAWRIEGEIGELADLARLELRHADAVLAEGLLSAMPAAWMEEFVAALRGPLLATMNQIGPATLLPLAPRTLVEPAARAGAVAIARLVALLQGRGGAVWMQRSEWRARGDQLALQRAWLDSSNVAGLQVRVRQMMQGRLQIRLPYCDVLALPNR